MLLAHSAEAEASCATPLCRSCKYTMILPTKQPPPPQKATIPLIFRCLCRRDLPQKKRGAAFRNGTPRL